MTRPPFYPEWASYAGYLLETLLTLVVVCGAAFAVLYGARRLGVGRPSGPLALAGHLPLDARRAIYLVRVGAQVFVVGASEAGFTKLGEMPAAEVPAQARGAGVGVRQGDGARLLAWRGRVNDELLSRPFALVVALAIVSLLPFVFMSVTAFVKISTVLQIVRSAIGAQSVPSNTVVLALATALTLLAMAPVGSRIVARAAPLLDGKEHDVALVREGIDAVREPMRDFLGANASAREKARFLAIARDAPARGRPRRRERRATCPCSSPRSS